MAKNLFVVNSSINLLSTFVLANSLFENDENYLALVHPHGYDRWKEDKILRFMSSPDAGFKQVFPLIDKVFSKHIDYVRKNIKTLNIDNVFLGNDCGVQNQLLMSTLGIKKFYRLDDGLGSYYKGTKRSWFRSICHSVKINFLARFWGIHTGFPFNTVAMGESKAAIGDCLLMPEILQRYSPKVIEITSEMIRNAMFKLMNNGLLKQELFDYKYIVYLSEPITEIKRFNFTFEDEVKIIKNIVAGLDSKTKLIYKPHPNDAVHKVEYIKENFKEVIVNESKLPVEFILYKEPLVESVVSYFCSTLIFAKKIVRPDIKCISLAKISNLNIDPMYIDMMKKVGVEFK